MTERDFSAMSKEALIRELEKMEAAERRFATKAGEEDHERIIYDLRVHQVQLEMQNRELRETQERLEVATSRYSELYDFAPVGYCTLNPEGRIQDLNLTAAALMGVPREALVGGPFATVAPLEDRRLFHGHMRRCRWETGRVTSELTFSVGKRGTRIVQIISDPVRDQSGATTAYRTILVDISDLKALENRLRLLSTLGERLASSVQYAHVIEEAARVTVSALCDVCMIDVVSAAGMVERKVVRFADPKKQRTLAERLMQFTPPPGWQTAQAQVVETGEPVVLAEVSAEQREQMSYDDAHTDTLRAAGIRSLMVVPLTARGRTLGALTLASTESERPCSSSDLQVAQHWASRIAMALDNVRLYEEARRTNAALRLSEAKASGILAIAADAIISIDNDQRITLFNEGAEKIFGYSKAEAVGAPLDILIPERFRAIHRQHVERFASSDQVSRRMGERGAGILGLRKSGEEFPADAAISKLELSGQRVLTVALRDVTDVRRFERAHKLLADMGRVLAGTLDYEETLTRVAEWAVRSLAEFCMIDVLEDDGKIRRLRVVGRDPSKQWICDALRNSTVDRSRSRPIWSTMDTKQPVLIEKVTSDIVAAWAQSDEHRRALREMEPRCIIFVPLVARGEVMGVLNFVSSTGHRAYGQDDLRLMEEVGYRVALAVDNARLYRTAELAIQARDQVLGVTAHDLRNPLHTIVLALHRLRRRDQGPERRAPGAIERIERSTWRMKRLIDDILNVVQGEAGRLDIEQAPFDAGKALAEFVEAQEPLASSKSLDLRLDVAPDVGQVFADHDKLVQVLQNLVENAAKFTEPGGYLTVGAAPRDGEVLFWVADTGAGIANDELPHVFDRFWRARKDDNRSLGLGLSIVKEIVQAHGGRVWVESQLGKGSTFFFALQRPDVERQVTEAAHERSKWPGDEESNRTEGPEDAGSEGRGGVQEG